MRDNLLRAKLKAKRELVYRLGYNPKNYTTLYRQEDISFQGAEKLECYSEGLVQEIFDPRSNRLVGHYFNPRDVFRLSKVTIEPRQGSIYAPDGKLIVESTVWSPSNYYESFPWNPGKGVKTLEVTDVINLTSNVFGHWLVEDLGSFLFLIDKFPNSPILVSQNHPKYISDIISNLGRDVIFHDGPVLVDSTIMLAKQQDSGWMHPKDLQVLSAFGEKVRAKDNLTTLEKVYATRRNLSRSPKNEKEIESLFEDFGFTTLRLEELDFIEEISLLSQTKVVAGVSGSWQFNSIWMEPGSKVIDIANEHYWTELIHRVCEMKRIEYHWAITRGQFESPVDIGELEELLKRISLPHCVASIDS